MGSVFYEVVDMNRQRNHRKARIGDNLINDYASVEEYRKRRAERLAARGIRQNEFRRGEGSVKLAKKELMKGLSHMDAPEGEEEQQNNGGRRGGRSTIGGGHGNTRLPF